jgi:hypothetical protein
VRTLFVVAAVLVTTGCGTPEPPPARTSRPRAPASPPVVARPDSELTNYLAWQRDWKLLANRHRAELEAESQRMENRYPLRATDSIAQDPGLLALLERQRGEMQLLMVRAPRGPTAEALNATLLGLGQLMAGPTGMTYVPGRNEAVLSAARAKYGDEFVRWVLARESTIIATLGADR